MKRWKKTPSTKDKIYVERANGRLEYWTYSDGDRVKVSRAWAEHQVCSGRAVYVNVA